MKAPAELSNTNKDTKRQHWLTHIKQWEESKLSQQAYCKQSVISLNSFTYWRGKFKSVSPQATKAKFVRVKVAINPAAPTETPRSIQIKLLTGHVVYIPATLDMSDIAKLIHLIGGPHA